MDHPDFEKEQKENSKKKKKRLDGLPPEKRVGRSLVVVFGTVPVCIPEVSSVGEFNATLQ